ncbi:transcriptional activator protein CzcR [Geobacter sp. OR-1]|uniref:response regulator n=1 Tax=Geobacter sp. OR-1 TaxID=1266765 RepID=UPI000542012D|nr:response regulator [Geobacter sp. OR-1]GAM10862.1 transcriptional activator protein CzcR [Geobacter sp. OR-1]
MKILVVDDEVKLVKLLKTGLVENGYRVDVAYDGNDALELATTTGYDIIILDIMLPGMDGREILRILREQNIMTPVIFLSALDQINDRIKGLQLGADDYLIKPFAFAELLARIEVVIHRCQKKPSEPRYVFGDLELDPANLTVARQGIKINLTPVEFKLLSLLMEQRSEPISRIRIAERIWDIDSLHRTKIVEVNISHLRRKIDDPFEKKLIHNVKGFGYILKDQG